MDAREMNFSAANLQDRLSALPHGFRYHASEGPQNEGDRHWPGKSTEQLDY